MYNCEVLQKGLSVMLIFSYRNGICDVVLVR